MIKCSVCKEIICKYAKDFRSCGAITILTKEKNKDICYDCARAITMELLEEEL